VTRSLSGWDVRRVRGAGTRLSCRAPGAQEKARHASPHAVGSSRGRAAAGWPGLLLVGALLLSGCASLPGREETPARDCESTLDSDERVAMQLAGEMMGEGRPYAALAELDALGTRKPEVRLARAQILARIWHPAAAGEFRAVKDDPCHRGAAYHGLGLLALREGDYQKARESFAVARRELPNVARVRNDYGFVLLMLGREADAEFELRSALELSEGGERPLENLLLLYLSRDDTEEMNELVRRYGVDAGLVERLDARAAQLAQARRAARGDDETRPVPLDGVEQGKPWVVNEWRDDDGLQ